MADKKKDSRKASLEEEDDLVDEKIVQAKQGFLEMNRRMKKRWSIHLPRCPIGEL